MIQHIHIDASQYGGVTARMVDETGRTLAFQRCDNSAQAVNWVASGMGLQVVFGYPPRATQN